LFVHHFTSLSLLLALFFLFGNFTLTALISALRKIHKKDSKKRFKELGGLFFYRPIHLLFFPLHEFEGIFFACISAQNLTRLCFAAFGALVINEFATTIWQLLASFFGLFTISFVFGDYIPRLLGTNYAEYTLRFCAPLSSFYLILSFPITFIFFKISKSFMHTISLDNVQEASAQAKQELIQIIQDSQIGTEINVQDKKLIESVFNFRHRIVREVMVPRVDVFSLPNDTPIKDATAQLESEGYSRVPVFSETVDNITGVLMYKDILAIYEEAYRTNNPKLLDAPVESIQKPVIYTPEMKKISHLLQEFRKQKMHLAIVVDEYGGTEGIITIEDILEEIVGDIFDEYDESEEDEVVRQPDGTWIVDARMSIFDAEEELNIHIPQEGDYDTIGGYIFHQSGSIPPKGFIIHQNDFEIEIYRSTDRSVEKVKIKVFPKEDEKKLKTNTEH
jgi:CBS domain containing-hemolysin-like protein